MTPRNAWPLRPIEKLSWRALLVLEHRIFIRPWIAVMSLAVASENARYRGLSPQNSLILTGCQSDRALPYDKDCMAPTKYYGLPKFGLPLITLEDQEFAELLREIQNRPHPFGPPLIDHAHGAAVLFNRSPKAIVALAYVWRYTSRDGETRTSRHSNLGSSLQMDVLAGRTGVARDRTSFILPNSKRLITEDGMWGDNFDVIAPESDAGGMGLGHGGDRGARRRRRGEDSLAGIELRLDVVFFEDGLCVGPDEFRLFENVVDALDRQRRTVQEIVEALQNNASIGRVFEILRPLASRSAAERDVGHHPLLWMFGRRAIDELVNKSGPELLPWFESLLLPSAIRLHRP
jgi:hypothetical protein